MRLNQREFALVIVGTVIISLVGLYKVTLVVPTRRRSFPLQNLPTEIGVTSRSPFRSNEASSATQGGVFRAKKERSFDREIDFDALQLNVKNDLTREKRFDECEKWAVVTTIFPPTKLIRQLEALEEWCLVVVGDKKSPAEYDLRGSRSIFLSAETQETLGYNILGELKWNHFGRKNVGYMFAIHHGAKVVYDTDDDNILISGSIPLSELTSNEASAVEIVHPKTEEETISATNIYSLFTSRKSWPRGFPLDLIEDPRTVSEVKQVTTLKDVQVFQSLANNDPDVDAIFRMTQGVPFDFDRSANIQSVVLQQSGMFSPFNAQATVFLQGALWGLILPVSVHGRVSDIWRSYMVERILWGTGGRVAFTSPFVKQCRNVHSYLGDFDAESDLYYKSGELLNVLESWNPRSTTVGGRLVELGVYLFERSIIEAKDVQLLEAWVQDLGRVGYKFPAIISSKEYNRGDRIAELHMGDEVCESSAVKEDICDLQDVVDSFYERGKLFQNVARYDEIRESVSKLRFLLLDAHRAPQIDTMSSLHLDFGVPKDNIAALCEINYCNKMQDLADLYSGKSFGVSSDVVRTVSKWLGACYSTARFVPFPTAGEALLDNFDVIVCGFPSWQCASLLDSNRVIMLRFAHSPWHHLHSLRGPWIELLRKHHNNPRLIISSNNPFHFVEYKHHVGRYPFAWPAMYIHSRGQTLKETYSPMGHPKARDAMVLGIGFEYDKNVAHVFDELKAITEKRGANALWKLFSFKEAVRPDDLRRFASLAVMYPYAAHTAKFTELYALGIPMLLPSIELLAKLSVSGVTIMTHLDGMEPPEGVCAEVNWPSNLLQQQPPSTRSRLLKYWLRFSEFYMWPGIYFYESFDSMAIAQKVDEIMADYSGRQRRSDEMLAFFDKLRAPGSSHSHILMALDRALKAGVGI